MFRKIIFTATVLLLILIIGNTYLASAQDTPPQPEVDENNNPENSKSEKFQPEGGSPANIVNQEAPNAIGGPDYFGYTWDDGVAFSWYGATTGTDTGMWGQSDYMARGPYNLPFDFHYYDEIYNEVWIAASGYLSFGDSSWWPPQQDPMPSSATPNNVVAPFWTVMDLDDTGPSGRVYYRSGGTAPNRYFVVEWFNVAGGTESDPSGGDETYRFEVVLFESGDILFQYHTMIYNDWRYYASIGIEDQQGYGLGYMDWGNYWDRIPLSGQAIRISRPAPAAYVSLTPLYDGTFTHAGQPTNFELSIRNTGEIGPDTYELTMASSSWLVSLYDQNGMQLSDTNGNMSIDTGSLLEGETKKVIVQMQTPMVTNIADSNSTSVTVTSSLDATKTKTTNLKAAVPSTFVQAFSSDDYLMSSYMVRSDQLEITKVAEENFYGNDHAISETSSFIYAWTRYFWNQVTQIGYMNIEYVALDDRGNRVGEIKTLVDHSTATKRTMDYEPYIAVLPNGNIGVTWYRSIYDDAINKYNYNIWFAVLDSTGSLLYGPQNLTMNNAWGDYSENNIPRYYEARISGTDDNRFVLSWRRYMPTASGALSDLYYAVRNSGGANILPATQFTNAIPGSKYYYDSNLASLDNNRALLVYKENYSGMIFFAVLNSAGSVVKSETGTGIYSYSPDAVQLSGGNILLACDGIQFVVLDGSTYAVVAGPTLLANPAAIMGDAYVSVTRDSLGNGILTWMDGDYDFQRNLYYALIDGSGNVLTQPMIFQSSEEYIESSYLGQGITTYSTIKTTNGVDTYIESLPLVSGTPNGAAILPVRFGNLGLSTATSVSITVTLDADLSYLSDTSGITPVQNGDKLTWSIPTDLEFLGKGVFDLLVSVPDLPYGTLLPVSIEIQAGENEADSSNNHFLVNVMVSRHIYLPLMAK